MKKKLSQKSWSSRTILILIMLYSSYFFKSFLSMWISNVPFFERFLYRWVNSKLGSTRSIQIARCARFNFHGNLVKLSFVVPKSVHRWLKQNSVAPKSVHRWLEQMSLIRSSKSIIFFGKLFPLFWDELHPISSL